MINIEPIKSNTTVWTGIYKGVNFEINNFQTDYVPEHQDRWTYYLFLHLDRIPKEHNPESYWLEPKDNSLLPNRVYYDYYNHSIIGSIEFHGGITWYSKETGFDNTPKIIKIGCDYSHIWDEGVMYSLEGVLIDVKNSIDSFLSFVPNYKYRCCGNGKLYDLSEGVIKNNSFYSKEYWGEKDWFKELENKTLS